MTATVERRDCRRTASGNTCTRCGRPEYHARGMCRACYMSAWYRKALPGSLAHETDEAVVLRLMAGEALLATHGERAEATRRLTQHGHSAAVIAERLRCDPRTVTRYRREARAA